MTLLEEELRKLSDERLRALVEHELPALAAAAKAELDSRPDAARGEAFLRDTFPRSPGFDEPAPHGTGCTCCGAGVKQWR